MSECKGADRPSCVNQWALLLEIGLVGRILKCVKSDLNRKLMLYIVVLPIN